MRYDCDKCPGTVHVAPDEIEEQINKVLNSGLPIADDRVYGKRLDICNSCEELYYGTTCMSCGCLVRVRALNALRICPHPSGNRW